MMVACPIISKPIKLLKKQSAVTERAREEEDVTRCDTTERYLLHFPIAVVYSYIE
jgi:hypothetical protein